VLSGFLITYLLIEEKKIYGQIKVFAFWKRRILRIWPLFFACVLFGFFVFPFLKNLFGSHPNETANIFLYLTFLNNFDFIQKGPPDASVLGVLWSVAIEEQFYLFWPVLLIAIPSHGYKYLFSFIIVGSLVFRGIFDNPVYNEYHTLSCIGDMTVGAFGALLLQRGSLKQQIELIPKSYIIALYAGIVLILLFRHHLQTSFYVLRVIERILIAVVFLFVILEQNFANNSLFKLSNFKRFSTLGTMTYGLYCLHFIAILITTKLFDILQWNTEVWHVLILQTATALSLTIIIAQVSYRYFELPFLRLKHKLSYIRTVKI
jgi:peptidoglycan/LPS O-acetylase OafA/YrhL